MQKLLCAGVVSLLLCGGAEAQTRVEVRDLGDLVVHCPAPVATVAIGRFNCKAAACAEAPAAAPGMAQILAMAAAAQGGSAQSFPQLGQGMSSAMTTALKATGCFEVLARDDLEDLQREAALAGVELKTKAADYLVSGAITSLAVSNSTRSLGGGLLPVVGGLNRSTKSAVLGIDIRLVDVKAGSVTASQSFDANSQKSNWGVGGAGYAGGAAFFGRSMSNQSPELDSVANQTVINAANYIAEQLAAGSIDRRPAAQVSTH